MTYVRHAGIDGMTLLRSSTNNEIVVEEQKTGKAHSGETNRLPEFGGLMAEVQ